MPECSNISASKDGFFSVAICEDSREEYDLSGCGELKAHVAFMIGDKFKVKYYIGAGHIMNLFDVSEEITRRLTRIFLRNKGGRRPVYESCKKF
jgi:hypothetical protein